MICKWVYGCICTVPRQCKSHWSQNYMCLFKFGWWLRERLRYFLMQIAAAECFWRFSKYNNCLHERRVTNQTVFVNGPNYNHSLPVFLNRPATILQCFCIMSLLKRPLFNSLQPGFFSLHMHIFKLCWWINAQSLSWLALKSKTSAGNVTFYWHVNHYSTNNLTILIIPKSYMRRWLM